MFVFLGLLIGSTSQTFSQNLKAKKMKTAKDMILPICWTTFALI